jgi:response regulator RpfG family c-di-GMP phosphodiesterase
MIDSELTLLDELDNLKEDFNTTIDKLQKDLKRSYKTIERSDKQQTREFLKLKALNKEIVDTQKEIIFTMGAIGESRSKETGNHVKRVAEYSKILALHYGMSEEESEMLKQASPMHDIGKVAIPDAILNKPARFTPEEFEIMKEHANLGHEMLKHSQRPLLKLASIVAFEHHERWDGKGYPQGTKGENINIYGRITALADVFDALGSSRVYKPAWEDEKIFNLFKEERGKQFDPKLIDIFFENLDQFLEIRDSLT